MKYFYHVTVNTGHIRRSYQHEVAPDNIQTMKEWFARMKSGEKIEIYPSYTCELLYSSSKLADFIVGFHSPKDGAEYDVIRFVVCLHSREKPRAWEIVEGNGRPLDCPFIAARIVNPQYVESDLADFERCIAWGFYFSVKGR